jgi:hypothetical protein
VRRLRKDLDLMIVDGRSGGDVGHLNQLPLRHPSDASEALADGSRSTEGKDQRALLPHKLMTSPS